jgi:hypothetical protein
MLRVNPHTLIVAGENSFLRLSKDESTLASHWVSHWRVTWSPVGAGHVLFIESPLVSGIKILTDNDDLAVFLQQDIESILHPQFVDSHASLINASFHRKGTPPSPTEETIESEEFFIRLIWSDFIKPFSFYAEPGFRGGSLGLQTTLFPARIAQFTVNKNEANGSPWNDTRGKSNCTSACLAWCETWYKPEVAN